MSVGSTITRYIVAVVTVAGVSACTTQHSASPRPGVTTAPAGAGPPTPSTDPSSAPPTAVAIKDLGKVPTWGTSPIIADDRYQVIPGDTSGHSMKVIERATRRLVLTHRVTRHGFEPTHASLYRDRLVLVDEDVHSSDTMAPGSGKKPANVTVYNLSTGSRGICQVKLRRFVPVLLAG